MTGHTGKTTRQVPTVLADRDFLSIELLSAALKRCQSYFEIVAQALNSAAAIRKLDELKPALALISIELQDGDRAGLKVLRHIRENHSQTATVALVHRSTDDLVLEAFRDGARGVVSREEPFRLLAQCLRKVHQGEIWAKPNQIDVVFESLRNEPRPKRDATTVLELLSPREREVATCIADGLRNAEIGATLGLKENTVRNYVMKIYDKLGVSNRVQLTRYCAPLLEQRGAVS